MNNNRLLLLIAIVLIGIFAVLAYGTFKESPEEGVAESIGEFTEEIQDEIDDATSP